MVKLFVTLSSAALLASTAPAQPAPKPDEMAFRATYKELVESRTAFSDGDCTVAAQRMAARLKAAGYLDSDLHIIVPDGKPKDGNLVAILPGRVSKAKAVLMLAHIDVVEAKREDWARDPFTLVEEAGYFYARGSRDDKAQAAIWVDNLIRFKQEGYTPRRTIKMALTCGEETGGFVNGVQWLVAHNREMINAGIALNEGGYGELDAQGRRVSHSIQAAEKTHVRYAFEATNPGGHSSLPVPDNAIYHVIRAVDRVSRHEFPVMLSDVSRAYFSDMAKLVGGETGAAMTAIVTDPTDARADAILSRDANYHAMLHTTCVATMMEAGHAPNALPQRATATISCRILPGVSQEQVYETLVKLVDNPSIKITAQSRFHSAIPTPSMTVQALGPLEKISNAMWPGVPLVPMLSPMGTDAPYLNAIGIPTFGISGLFVDPDGGRPHGLNERIRAKSLIEAREFLYRLVKAYADQPGK